MMQRARMQLDDGRVVELELHIFVELLQGMCLGERRKDIYATEG